MGSWIKADILAIFTVLIHIAGATKPVRVSMDATTGQETSKSWPSNDQEKEANWEKPYTYTVTSIFLVGLVGNCLILVCLRNKDFRRSSTGVYLSFLSVADNLVLVSGLYSFLTSQIILGINVQNVHVSICFLIEYLQYFGGLVSSWTLVVITGERLVVILKPHRWENMTGLIHANSCF